MYRYMDIVSPQGFVPRTTAPTPAPKLGKWKASRMVVKESWAILKKDREILWFPVLSAIALLVAYAVIAIANFFQAGIMIIAHGRFNGQDLAFGDGLRGASSKFGKIFVWSLISATVGIIFDQISRRS